MRLPRNGVALALLLAGALGVRPAMGEPFVPKDDGEVLERLPEQPLSSGERALRRDLGARPGNLRVATRLAWEYVGRGRATSDPRYYGYAEGVLAPWWSMPEPPVPVLVLRATIRQHDHDFDGAMSDLDRALAADPDNAQAWLTRAIVAQVRGDLPQARESCDGVLRLASPLVAVACLSGTDALGGEAEKAYAALRRALERSGPAEIEAQRWGLSLLAEIAARLGRAPAAEAHFRQALALGRADDQLRAAYADFLLDAGRPHDVETLLGESPSSDGLRLRLALAGRMQGSPATAARIEALRQGFAAARRRGDTVHRREEALFTLRLLERPRDALRLASENWEVQREPLDARILLEAALAAGEPAAAAPVLDFLRRTGLDDARLAALAEAARKSLDGEA